jgi:predicted alpha/beta-hydrolase family hydrolase
MLETYSVDAVDGPPVSARVYRSRTPTFAALILAHGAGAGQSHPFMVRSAEMLADRGVDVVTFNFAYADQGRRRPDPAAVLEGTWRSVVEWTRAAGRLPGPLFAGGKSMGGRIASQVAAADGPALGVSGLVFLGYPLHPPGKPDQLRVRHFPQITVPMLFVQGTRDAFGTPDELRPWLATSPAPAEVYVVNGGDHSFGLPKSQTALQDATRAGICDRIAGWMRDVAGAARADDDPGDARLP